ncbi:MAG: phosphoribosyltransferase family protein [Sulfurimonadaceae bacterium]|jgi:competence protein ComFC|nr:phosphoribosyltransferase family protein [Sulfurimonadaceae bacterium]
MCETPSWTHICLACQKLFLTPSLYERKLKNTTVYSFYKYSEIKNLLYTKHTDLGFYIYTILAQNSFKKFSESFSYPHKIASLGVDEDIKSGYSHTAILSKSLRNNYITPLYGKLHAINKVKYSGKSKAYRLMHPRNFRVEKFSNDEVIVVDDIITTGLTLSQAVDALTYQGKEVLFCLTLADARLE